MEKKKNFISKTTAVYNFTTITESHYPNTISIWKEHMNNRNFKLKLTFSDNRGMSSLGMVRMMTWLADWLVRVSSWLQLDDSLNTDLQI